MGRGVSGSVRYSLLLSVPVWCVLVAGASAACVTDASHNVTCDGTINQQAAGQPQNTGYPIVVYDKAANIQPPANGGNGYTPTTYSQNPDTAIVTINPGASFTVNVTAANRGQVLADNGVIAANFSNKEDPAVNNVTINNFGSIVVTNNIITNRVHALVADSQVNTFTVNNAAGATIAVNQAALNNTTFNSALLQNTAAGTPATYTPRYGTATTTLAITSGIYSDDNTNTVNINNAGTISATGHYAAAYYGRAETTIVNTGTFGNSDWKATDNIYDGHWAVGTYAGAEFATLPGSNPDTPIYDVRNIAPNAQGVMQGTVAITDTATTTITNKGTINGDILVLDTNPLVTAIAAARGQALPLAVSASNSGPRDSSIDNSGVINGNLYLGSGDHEITNHTGATINGSINVDQRPSVGTFAANPTPGTAPGTYQSVGPATMSSTGGACPAAGSNTTDLYCARTTTVLATFVGDQSLTLKNRGTLNGDITIIDQPTSENRIVLYGSGFSGNITAVNGTGDNTLVLHGVTNLASVRNFSTVNLNRSNVTVANGISLVDGATLRTTVYGRGGTNAAPSTQVGTINGTLTLAGATALAPKFRTFVRNGDVYQVASAVNGPGAGDITVQQKQTALLRNARVDTSDGRVLLTAQVRDARTISGISRPAGATLQGLLTYGGLDPKVLKLGAAVERLQSAAAVRQAGTALSPITNGADIQIPINTAMLFHQQIDSRLDSFIFAQIPVSGRSADLGVARPVYGVIPPSAGWIEAIGGGVHQSTVAGVGGYNAELEGVIGGYDRLITPNIRVGGAFGYVGSRVGGNDNGGRRENIQSYQGLLYGEYAASNYYLRGSAGYGGVDFQSQRQISFPGFNDIAFGKHGGDIFTARGEGGVPFEYRNALLVPYAAFTYSRLHQNAYQEQSANGAGLFYRTANNDSDRSEAGGKVIVPLVNAPLFSYLFPATSFVAVEARAAYVHEFGNVAQTVTAGFTGGGGVFVAAGPVPNRDMVDYGVGLRMGSGRVQFDISYNGLARGNYLQQVGLLRARYLF